MESDKKKERIELQFNLNSEVEKELLDFIDQNGTTRAGFIKSVVRQYMNTIQSLGQNTTPSPNMKPEKSKQIASKKNKQESSKKKMPKLGTSFSSKDLDN